MNWITFFKISSMTKFHLTPLTTKQINTGILLVKKPIQNLSATHKNQKPSSHVNHTH